MYNVTNRFCTFLEKPTYFYGLKQNLINYPKNQISFVEFYITVGALHGIGVFKHIGANLYERHVGTTLLDRIRVLCPFQTTFIGGLL
jgi:hypothetical protein